MSGPRPRWVSIEHRPVDVAHRTRLGDWELDTIIGKGHHQALVSLTERKSRLSLLSKVVRKSADAFATALIALLYSPVLPLYPVTSDNGKDFAHHETIAKALKIRYFFAYPYAARERGINESTMGSFANIFPTTGPLRALPRKRFSWCCTNAIIGHENTLGSKPRIKYDLVSSHSLHLHVESNLN